MKKRASVIYVVAECRDCSWHSEAYKNGQALAAIHAKKHKHLVVYELGIAGEYDGR